MLIHGKNSDSEVNNKPSSAHGKHETTMDKDICVGKDICMCDDRWWRNMGDTTAGLVRQIYGRVKVQVLFINNHCVERL
jgi:hypothetical protein